MAQGTVVVLPDAEHAALRGMLLNGDFACLAVPPVGGPPASAATRLCAAVAAAAPEPPLTIVAFGSTALLLPAIALAQRAAHRRVVEYVLVEPSLPDAGDTWPDARVTVFDDDPGPIPGLRGWDVWPVDDLARWSPQGLD